MKVKTKITLKKVDAIKFIKNLVVFTAPALAIFCYQLSQGVEPKKACWVAVLALYGILADLFKKISKK